MASPTLDRRTLLGALAAYGALAACKRADQPGEPHAKASGFEKAKDLIVRTDRPPNLETPDHYFRKDFTPNEAFFVRWHLSGIPTSVDPLAFRLRIFGHVERPSEWSLDQLRTLESVTVAAINQCSGNQRSFFEPRVPGVQWGRGAIGLAKWRGVRLRDLLERAGIKEEAKEITFAGMDTAPLPSTPAYVKSLDAARAMMDDVLVAYEMNGAPLPMLNGFPLRLVVPGWYSTYWVKALHRIEVLPQAFDGFWMKKAYRIPKTEWAHESPQNLAPETVPISKMNVRSFFVQPSKVDRVVTGQRIELEGLAFDGGSGIKQVDVSFDAGQSWTLARLDTDHGKYAWRRWRFDWTPAKTGEAQILVRATSVSDEVQRTTPHWNRAGYMLNAYESLRLTVTG